METLKKNKDFSKVYRKALKLHSKYSLIFVCKKNNNTQKESLFGFVASKKTGNAIKRNRIKRLFKEVVRKNANYFDPTNDYVIVGKSNLKENIGSLKYQDIEKDILLAMKKIKIGK